MISTPPPRRRRLAVAPGRRRAEASRWARRWKRWGMDPLVTSQGRRRPINTHNGHNSAAQQLTWSHLVSAPRGAFHAGSGRGRRVLLCVGCKSGSGGMLCKTCKEIWFIWLFLGWDFTHNPLHQHNYLMTFWNSVPRNKTKCEEFTGTFLPPRWQKLGLCSQSPERTTRRDTLKWQSFPS